MCLACTWTRNNDDYPGLDKKVLELADKWQDVLGKWDENGKVPNSHIPAIPSPEWFMLSRYVLLKEAIEKVII